MKKLLGLLLVLFLFSSCENFMAKKFGGTVNVDLPKNEKLVTVTWKDGDLWYLTEVRPDSVKAKTYKFREKSNMGVMEGLVIIKEN